MGVVGRKEAGTKAMATMMWGCLILAVSPAAEAAAATLPMASNPFPTVLIQSPTPPSKGREAVTAVASAIFSRTTSKATRRASSPFWAHDGFDRCDCQGSSRLRANTFHSLPYSSQRGIVARLHIGAEQTRRRAKTIVSPGAVSMVVDPIVMKTSISAMSELFAQIGLGYAAVRVGLLDSKFLPALSRTVFNIFLPALLCTSVARTVASNPIGSLIPIPLFAMMQVFGGLLLSRFVLKLVGVPIQSEQGKIAQVLSSFQNSGVLPIAFINTLFRADIDKLDHATALTAVFLLGWSPLFWSLGKHLMSGGEGGGGAIDKQLQQGGGGKNADDNDGGGGRSGLLRSAVVRAVSRVLKIMELVKEMILTNPPIAGCLLGVLIGVVHPIRDLFLSNAATGYVAPLGMIANGMRNMALGSIPLSVLVLAGTMAQKRPPPPPPLANKSSDAAVEVVGNKRRLGLIALSRFLLVPFTSLLAVNFAVKTGLIANDPILIFVLLLQSAMPSAQNSVTILQVLDKPAEAQKVARLLLKIYAMSIVPVSAWVTFFLHTSGVLS